MREKIYIWISVKLLFAIRKSFFDFLEFFIVIFKNKKIDSIVQINIYLKSFIVNY